VLPGTPGAQRLASVATLGGAVKVSKSLGQDLPAQSLPAQALTAAGWYARCIGKQGSPAGAQATCWHPNRGVVTATRLPCPSALTG
jgi:hypothetical protein